MVQRQVWLDAGEKGHVHHQACTQQAARSKPSADDMKAGTRGHTVPEHFDNEPSVKLLQHRQMIFLASH